MWSSLLRGLVLGFVGGVPIGPVNAAVIDTAFRRSFMRAFAIGLGGALADFALSQGCVAGLAPFIQSQTNLGTILLGVGGVVLVAFGLITARTRASEPMEPVSTSFEARALACAVLSGVLITILNPASLVTWVLAAGTVLADLSRWEALIAGVGIFAGTALWFAGVAWLAAKGRVRLGERSVWVTRTVGTLLVVYGVFLVGRASVVVWAARH